MSDDDTGKSYLCIDGERIPLKDVSLSVDFNNDIYTPFKRDTRECDGCGGDVLSARATYVSSTDSDRSGVYHRTCVPE